MSGPHIPEWPAWRQNARKPYIHYTPHQPGARYPLALPKDTPVVCVSPTRRFADFLNVRLFQRPSCFLNTRQRCRPEHLCHRPPSSARRTRAHQGKGRSEIPQDAHRPRPYFSAVRPRAPSAPQPHTCSPGEEMSQIRVLRHFGHPPSWTTNWRCGFLMYSPSASRPSTWRTLRVATRARNRPNATQIKPIPAQTDDHAQIDQTAGTKEVRTLPRKRIAEGGYPQLAKKR